jgi:hypothetical protein
MQIAQTFSVGASLSPQAVEVDGVAMAIAGVVAPTMTPEAMRLNNVLVSRTNFTRFCVSLSVVLE